MSHKQPFSESITQHAHIEALWYIRREIKTSNGLVSSSARKNQLVYVNSKRQRKRVARRKKIG